MQLLKPMDYARVVTRKGIKGSGLDIGQIVMVMGMKVLPVTKSDPYLQRIYAVCLLVTEDGEHLVPNPEDKDKDNGNRSYLLDPRQLDKLPDDAQDELKVKLEEQYDSTD